MDVDGLRDFVHQHKAKEVELTEKLIALSQEEQVTS